MPRHGLKTSFRGRELRHLAREVLDIASAGLAARKREHWQGRDESSFLKVLYEIVESGVCPAQGLIDAYLQDNRIDFEALYRECAY